MANTSSMASITRFPGRISRRVSLGWPSSDRAPPTALPVLSGGSSSSASHSSSCSGRAHAALFDGAGGRHTSCVSWHDRRVERLFNELDAKRRGSVTLEQVHESLARLHVYVDEHVFEQLAHAHVIDPEHVKKPEFVAFHEAVAQQRTSSMRRHSSEGPVVRPDGPRLPRIVPPVVVRRAAGSLQRANSLSSMTSSQATSSSPSPPLLEGTSTNARLLAVFERHSKDGKYITRSLMPELFTELGLDLDLSITAGPGSVAPCRLKEFAGHQFDRADRDGDGRVTFDEFVDYHARYTALLEEIRSSELSGAFRRCQRVRAFGG